VRTATYTPNAGCRTRPTVKRRRFLPLATTALLLLPCRVAGQDATSVFERFAPSVVKVEVIESGSGAPSSVGTGFFVGDSLLLTNYHVVRSSVFEPTRYGLRLVSPDAPSSDDVRVFALDPTTDLAVLRVRGVRAVPLRLRGDPVAMGQTLYSLGHPGDLQTAVVEGVYNGPVESSVTPLVHFTGSINPGMSGGPAVTADGEVVGVNVSTAGDQLSFLVPATAAAELVALAATGEPDEDEDLLAQVSRRLTEFQESFFRDLGDGGFPSTRIGGASMPTAPDERIDCTADQHEIEGERYALTEYRCRTEDAMLLGPRGSYDLIYLEHMHMSSEDLSPFAFSALVTDWYQTVLQWEAPANEDATTFRCEAGNLGEGLATEMLVTFCTRRHRSHGGMYDLLVRSATVKGTSEAVVSTLRASPISHANAVSLAGRWLSAFSWR
jgi:serine protease Do